VSLTVLLFSPLPEDGAADAVLGCEPKLRANVVGRHHQMWGAEVVNFAAA